MDAHDETFAPGFGGIVLAVIVAIIALFLSLFALGRALADVPSGGQVTAEGAAGADTGPGEAEIDLAEFTINPGTIVIGEGGTLLVANEGEAEHNLKVRDTGLGTPDLASGENTQLSVTSLTAGTYEVFCDIAGHADAGMVATLQVGATTGDEAAVEGGGGDPGEALTGMARAEWLLDNYEDSITAFPADTMGDGNQAYTGELQDDGTTLFELEISRFEWEISPGEIVEVIGYNGMVPGPVMKAEVGQEITVRVINSLDDESTSLHPHGIFMHPLEADGVGLIAHDPIMPGDTYEVTFTTAEPSVGMYHGHDNGVGQVLDGAFGAWLVGEMPLPIEADNVVDEQVMILNDAGAIGLTLNAKSFPATTPYVMKKGEQMVLHYYNEGLTAHPMHLHNNAQMVIAKDGYPLAQPYFVDTLNIAPGERYSVVIFAEVPGTWVFHCHILTHVEKEDGSVFGMFTALVVEDSGDPEVDASTERIAGQGRAGAPAPLDPDSGNTIGGAIGSEDEPPAEQSTDQLSEEPDSSEAASEPATEPEATETEAR